MKLPREVPVMTLANATLFPQALLPLHIFEPRYRRMLADALKSHRMLTVAMQRPGTKRESPVTVAGLGLIRAAVKHPDGTSHLILQGLVRVQLIGAAVRYRPYRVHCISPLQDVPADNAVLLPLVANVRELVVKCFQMGMPPSFPIVPPPPGNGPDTSPPLAREILDYLDRLASPEQVADLVSCAVLSGASERQAILETVNVEARLRRLIKFLRAGMARRQKGKTIS